MLGFFSLFKDRQNIVKKSEILFVHVPDGIPDEELRIRFSKLAMTFANKLDANKVYLNFGKDKYIEYEYKI